MKKILITIGLAALVTSSQAQGLLNFVNAAATVVGLVSNAVDIGTTPATLGGFRYEIFRGSQGNLNPALMIATGAIGTNTSAGRFVGGNSLAVPGAPLGASAAMMVRGWSANLGANYATALVNSTILGGYIGESAIAPNFQFGGDPGTGFIPSSPVFGGAFGIVPQSGTRGFSLTYVPVVITPEPTSMALAGIGAAAMVIFRRRK